MRYRIQYSREAIRHLAKLTARQRRIVANTVDKQLMIEPTVETRSRKPMRPNPVADWELKIGDFRVYYDVEGEPVRQVSVVAVGLKVRNRVLIGGEEVEL